MQVAYQLTACVSSAIWAFLWTLIILQLINLIPFFKLKATDTEEEQ